MHPRDLWHMSNQAFDTLARLFTRCEDLLSWPSERIVNVMVRIPKEEGGSRLICLVSTLVRVWARARRPLSRDWIKQHRHASIFGLS